MSSFLGQAGTFLIQVIFGFYILAVLLRLLLQLVRADFYNPISQLLVALTNPPLVPLRRIIPGLYGIDFASVLLLVVLKSIELFLAFAIRGRYLPGGAFILLAVSELLTLTCYVFLVAIIIRVLLSWFAPYGRSRNPAVDLLYSLSEPVLRPARRLIPAIGGLDLSPIIVLVLLQIGIMFIEHMTAELVRLTL